MRLTHGDRTLAHGDLATVRLADGPHELRWGLLRPWQGHGGKRGANVYEATLGAIAATPFLRKAAARRRCLVTADGIVVSSGVAHGEGDVMLAGIAACHPDDRIDSFALVVVPPPPLVAGLVEAMPAVVDERWLAASDLVVLPLDGWRITSPGANRSQRSLF